MTLQDRIKAACTAFLEAAPAGWTPRALSLAAGCGPFTVRELLAGRDVRVSTADALAMAVRTHAPDTAEGRRAAALADWSVAVPALESMDAPDRNRNGMRT